MKDYQQTFEFDKSNSQIYSALTEHISDWWTNDFSGAAKFTGDQFSIGFGRTRKTMEVIEAIPDKQVVWKCIKAHIDMAALTNKSEWEGTTMSWTINNDGPKTTLTFLHRGLNQNLECYDVCEAGWNTFLASLHACVTTGKGAPFIMTAL